MFVDDALHHHNNKDKDISLQLFMVNVRTDIEMWGQSIWTTGGLLEFIKSSYFILAWKFTPEGCSLPIKEKELPKNNVQVTDAHETTTTLTKVPARKGGKILDIHKAATLGKTAEFQYLKSKATTYIQAMNACLLPPHKAWLCYLMVYCPSITCSLSTTFMSKKQIGILHTPVTPRILPRMGYQQNSSNTVVYGSKFSGGIGFIHFQAYQLKAKVTGAMQHARAQTKIGKEFTIMVR
eukprot:466981-Ditylum_brightwellii.AAC.1